MLILSIESSCDETSLALLEGTINPELGFYKQINEFKIVDSLISSQIDIHKQYGGVIPEIGFILVKMRLIIYQNSIIYLLLPNLGLFLPCG